MLFPTCCLPVRARFHGTRYFELPLKLDACSYGSNGSRPSRQDAAKHAGKASSRGFFRCLFSMMTAASGSDCSALFSLSPSSLATLLGSTFALFKGTKFIMRGCGTSLHVARSFDTSRKSFLGQLRPLSRCGSPHLDKLLLSSSQMVPRPTGLASPTGLRLNQLKS